MSWYVARNGERSGPISEIALRRLAASGSLKPDDLLWRPGFSGWTEASRVPGVLYPPSMTGEEDNVSEEANPSSRAALNASRNPQSESFHQSRKSSNFFLRHWRGELSLPISYWFNMVCLSLIFALSAQGLFESQNHNLSSRAGVGFTAVFVIACFGVSVWQIVGVWRSASNYASQNRPRFWSGAAKLACLVAGLTTVTQIIHLAPGLQEMARIAIGTDDINEYQINVIGDGTELEIRGDIAFGIASDVHQVLAENPAINIVHLNSPGGRIGAAKNLYEVFLEEGVTTYSSTYCLSACTIAYLGGNTRLLHKYAKLGFHQYAFPGLTARDMVEAQEIDRRLIVDRGVSPDFADQVFQATAQSMWYPTADDLQAAGYVHQLVAPGQTAQSGLSKSTLERTQQMLAGLTSSEETRFVALLATQHPEFERELRALIARRLEQNATETELADSLYRLGQEAGLEYLAFHLHRMDDTALTNVVAAMTDVIRGLIRRDDDSCYRWMFGSTSGQVKMPPTAGKRLIDAVTAGLQSAISNPIVHNQGKVPESDLELLFTLMEKEYGSSYIRTLSKFSEGGASTASQRRELCLAGQYMYESALKLPRRNAGRVLRYLFSEGL